MSSLWPHQKAGLAELDRRIEAGARAVCVTSPTGGGKTRLQLELIRRDWPVVLYTNRKMLREQTSAVLAREGIAHGVRAAGSSPEFMRRVQVASIQTEDARTLKAQKWQLHHARCVLVDEAHNETGQRAGQIIKTHLEAGAVVVGFTATPVGLGHLYRELVVAGTNAELRNCGAHVPAIHYGPDEPDTKGLKRTKTGEYEVAGLKRAIMTPTIFGRVRRHFEELNPEHKPSLGFAPGVAESLWFAHQFEAWGIPAAHIDATKVWLRGETMDSTPETRARVAEASRTGEVAIVWNRFVMREGVDWPWLAHGVIATAFGSLTSYLQAGGRLIRNHPSLGHVTIQDHGGNWHRHGSLNADREWELEDTPRKLEERRAERLREKQEPEPIVCRKCNAVRLHGPECPGCGHRSDLRTRHVVQRDGSLKEVTGDIYTRRRVSTKPQEVKKWEACFWRCRKARRPMTFKQAVALYYRETGRWPSPQWGYMPRQSSHMALRIADVPFSELHGGNN